MSRSSDTDREPFERQDDPVVFLYTKAYRKDGQSNDSDDEFAVGDEVEARLREGAEGMLARMELVFEVRGDGSALISRLARPIRIRAPLAELGWRGASMSIVTAMEATTSISKVEQGSARN